MGYLHFDALRFKIFISIPYVWIRFIKNKNKKNKKINPEEANTKNESNMKCQSEIVKIKMAKMKIITNFMSQKCTLFSKRKSILFIRKMLTNALKSIGLRAIFKNILLEKW